MIITTYQVVQVNPTATGPTTYANQLNAAYTQSNRNQPHNLHHHHATDLVSFVQDCQTAGDLVIAAGDFNKTIGTSTSGLTKLVTECNLVDACLS